MNDRFKSLALYSAKCVCGCLMVFFIASLIHYTDMAWCLISVVLVLSADEKDAVSIALTRMKANAIGAAAGIVCLLMGPGNPYTVSLAVVITLSVCYLFKLDAAMRTALGAAIIVMLHPEGKHLWNTATERVIAVMAGCTLGLLITLVFHIAVATKNKGIDFKKRQQEEKLPGATGVLK